jgi:hypothetical protein
MVKSTDKSKKARCCVCKKKIGLIVMTCKCGKKTCINHMYPSLHNCKYDFKTEAKNLLIKKNPTIVSDKIDNRLETS